MIERNKLLGLAEGSCFVSSFIDVTCQFNLAYKVPFLDESIAQIYDGYASDFCAPYATYLLSRTFLPERFQKPKVIASAIYGICVARELLQGRLLMGNTDPVDLLLYTASIGAAIGLDHLISNRKGRLRLWGI